MLDRLVGDRVRFGQKFGTTSAITKIISSSPSKSQTGFFHSLREFFIIDAASRLLLGI
jgi:hypothetical protein